MKIVMALGILIGILLCILFYMMTRYTGNTVTDHVKIIEKTSYDIIKTVCHQQIEYITINGNGTAIAVAVDGAGKPLKCSY